MHRHTHAQTGTHTYSRKHPHTGPCTHTGQTLGHAHAVHGGCACSACQATTSTRSGKGRLTGFPFSTRRENGECVTSGAHSARRTASLAPPGHPSQPTVLSRGGPLGSPRPCGQQGSVAQLHRPRLCRMLSWPPTQDLHLPGPATPHTGTGPAPGLELNAAAVSQAGLGPRRKGSPEGPHWGLALTSGCGDPTRNTNRSLTGLPTHIPANCL